MGQRREHRGPAPRSDLEILASDDIPILQAIASGAAQRARAGASPVFLIDGLPVVLRRLEREDLCTAPISGLPVLLPRGQRLLATSRGEIAPPLPE